MYSFKNLLDGKSYFVLSLTGQSCTFALIELFMSTQVIYVKISLLYIQITLKCLEK